MSDVFEYKSETMQNYVKYLKTDYSLMERFCNSTFPEKCDDYLNYLTSMELYELAQEVSDEIKKGWI